MGKVHLITGYAGEEHIHSADQGSFNASFFGGGEYVMEAGNQLEASIMDNNTVRILDGDLLMQGRHIRIENDTYEDITITTGTAGVNRNDLIVMQYSKDTSTDIETAELVVIKGTETEGTASDPEYTSGDILAGATFNQMPLYRVNVEGVVLTAVEPLFTTIPTYKKLAEQYAKQFQEACNTYLGALNILDTKEEIEANTKANQLAGALALKEVIASISDIVNNQVTTRYVEEADMWQMKTVSDGVWHDWKKGGLGELVLFDYGDACVSESGGWGSFEYRPSDKTSFNAYAPIVAFNATDMTLSHAPEQYRAGTVFNGTPKDLTNFSKLCVELESPNVGYAAALIRPLVSHNRIDGYNCTASAEITGSVYYDGVVEVNISNVTGAKYIGLFLQNADASTITGKTYTVKVKRVWLK